MAYSAAAAAAAAARRQPIFLPGFDRHTQLAMGFATVKFSSAWLRRTFTNENDPSVQVRLAADDHSLRERRLVEVRFGNNITLLLKACYFFRDFHGSGLLWTTISRVLNVRPDVAESVADIFVEARAIYLSNYSAARDIAPLTTEATHWVDKWTSFLDDNDDAKYPTSASDSEAFAAVEDFFSKERSRNGDLACILSKGTAMDPPSAPRALRKRSPSPSASQWTPNAKRRAVSRSIDEPVHGSPPGRGRPPPSSDPKPEPHETTFSTNGRQHQNDQVRRTSQGDHHFGLKIRGQAQKDSHSSPNLQDQHWSEEDEYEALVQSNIELQCRVSSLEKERLEATRAQKDRDDAIRTLQARFATFEKASAAADAQSSLNDKLTRETQEMVQKLSAQAEKLQQMEKQLELSDQAAQRMQATISALQKDVAIQAQPANGQAEAMTAESPSQAGQEAPETLKKNVSEIQVRMMSLEAKSVFFNNLHKSFQEMKAEIAAQKDKEAAPPPDPAKEQDKQDTPTRLRAFKEAMEKQGRVTQGLADRVVALEDQATVRNARIASLESRPDTAEAISRLKSRVYTVEQSQINDLKVLDCRLAAMQSNFDEMQGNTKELTKRLDDAESLTLIEAIVNRVTEMRTRLAKVEEHGTETSKRLDDMEVSQDALTLHDQSARIDEVAQALESLKTLLLGLARSDDVETLRAEFKALSQEMTAAGQTTSRGEDAHGPPVTSMVQSLSDRITRLDELYESHLSGCRDGPDQPLHTAGDNVQDGEQNDVSAIIDSLCQRVNIMENGFYILRDAMSGPPTLRSGSS